MTEDERAWPCDDYLPPLTCYTTPKPKTLTCEGCKAAFPNGPDVRDSYAARSAAPADETLRAGVEALRDLSQRATAGVWRQEFYRDGELLPDGTGGMDDYETPGRGVYVIDESSPEGYCLVEFEAGRADDAAFIVAAVNYVRALLDATATDTGGQP